MGRASAHTMVLKVFSAFSDKKRWTQADLARHTKVKSDRVRQVLEELIEEGWSFERKRDHPHTVWTAPERFLPGVFLTPDDVHQLWSLLKRLKPSAARDAFIKRLQQAKRAATYPSETARTEDSVIELVEWACQNHLALELDYLGHNDIKPRRRFVSVQHIGEGGDPRFVVRCHNDDKLKLFRYDNVRTARVTRSEPFRPVPEADVRAYVASSYDGFHANVAPLRCVFHVTAREASWVARNLPGNLVPVPDGDAFRFTVETSGIEPLARLLAGLGDVVRIETPELRARVRALAEGVLRVNPG